MKRLILILFAAALLLSGCAGAPSGPQIAATTLPVYDFTQALCQGTGLTVGRLVNESVSCLHDYSLSVQQVRMVEQAELVVISGAGLEDFMSDLLANKAPVIDSSEGVELFPGEHETDSHIWLSPENGKAMAQNICNGLSAFYPEHKEQLEKNLVTLLERLDTLSQYGQATLSDLSCRELITFHDGFSYFADAFDLTILAAVEEESGSEASAADLKELIALVRQHKLPAVFTETNGSDSAAEVIRSETGAAVFSLDMAMSGDSYFEAMEHNIRTIKEALG